VKLAPEITVDDYFAGHDEARVLFEVIREAVLEIGPTEVRATKSQVAFRRRLTFAWAWMPGLYLHGVVSPLVLTIDLRHRDTSERWKEIVEPRPGRFTHHLEVRTADDIDGEVLGWLREAWSAAV